MFIDVYTYMITCTPYREGRHLSLCVLGIPGDEHVPAADRYLRTTARRLPITSTNAGTDANADAINSTDNKANNDTDTNVRVVSRIQY